MSKYSSCYFLAAAFLCSLVAGSGLAADEKRDVEKSVDDALRTLRNFKNDPDMGWFRDHLPDAQALFIVPKQVKGGFIFGGSGGRGVLIKREGNQWVGPAFYNMGAGSVGLQVGVQVSEVVLMVLTKRGVDAFLSTKFQLGGDVSVAAGPVGAGAQGATADIQGFTRSKGAFAGFSFEGAVITPSNGRNETYYDAKGVSPSDILVRHKVENGHAKALLAEAAKSKSP